MKKGEKREAGVVEQERLPPGPPPPPPQSTPPPLLLPPAKEAKQLPIDEQVEVRGNQQKGKKFIVVDGGNQTHDRKKHSLSTAPIVKVIRRVLVRLTTCKMLTNNSLAKLSLTTLTANVSRAWM